ncbi:MAG: hypothetical protein IJG38_07740 [Thermoguttaceae bacterium]|nr:hypothetical protein [Thermoguttaceae bacterium]
MKSYRQKINPCFTRAFELAAQGLEQDAKDPQKQGLLRDGANTGTQFGTQSNYFNQILSFFDTLEPSEQESLLDALKARVKEATK